jgi:hypothetical protein
MFLVRPDLPESDRLFAQQYDVRVAVHRHGGEIPLPTSADRPFTASPANSTSTSI